MGTITNNPKTPVSANLGEMPPDEIIFGVSQPMQLVRQKVERVACADIPVLIQGESGTGKEVVAKLIHSLSTWADGPLVKVNCPAIPGTLLESELFGYERGAFTGAYGSKPGRAELANGGTLFLDEISELELGLQAKFLQFLQEGRFCRIGGKEDTQVEARVICATNRQLEQEVQAGKFREDLFYRINVVKIQLPRLAQRREDIPGLTDYFLAYYNEKFNCQAPPLSSSLTQLLQKYEWPGNIRQLENLIKRYVVLGSEDSVVSELSVPTRGPMNFQMEIAEGGSISLKRVTRDAVQALEREIILKALQAHHWNQKRAAKALSISYRALLYKIRQADLPSARARTHVNIPEPVGVGAED
ncbi:MAG: sigma 54-interacting transcriptional regulator [Acidobacteriia bacterium]|nr:sigma 54-interacting transcriptional regulator [Terriglobia bacterium]